MIMKQLWQYTFSTNSIIVLIVILLYNKILVNINEFYLFMISYNIIEIQLFIRTFINICINICMHIYRCADMYKCK